MNIPRILFAAPASGSGKTLLTCAFLQAVADRGIRVSSFKCGPDYIDPMFHTRVIGIPSQNLDSFFLDRQTLCDLLCENASTAELSVIEGVMGYYDGLGGVTTRASTYEVARMTQTPVVLVIPAKGMSRSVLALIRGFLTQEPDSGIRGVILNRVSPMVYPLLKKMIEEKLSVTVYGYLPQMNEADLSSRHLGLVMPDEINDLRDKLHMLSAQAEKSIDIDGLLALAGQAEELTHSDAAKNSQKEPVRIALACDESFCFFYQENLQLLTEMGAELVRFSPIHDTSLPERIDGLLLYGGYPELYARELSENESMRSQIAAKIREGLPCIAECGGFLYLQGRLEDSDGQSFPMAGIFSGTGRNTGSLARFGYVTLEGGTAFGRETGSIPAHEFHYYDCDDCGEAYEAVKPVGSRHWSCMYSTETLLAGFPHLYYRSNPSVAEHFLEKCRDRKESET